MTDDSSLSPESAIWHHQPMPDEYDRTIAEMADELETEMSEALVMEIPEGIVLRHSSNCRWHSIEGGACNCNADQQACADGARWLEWAAVRLPVSPETPASSRMTAGYLLRLAEQLRAGEQQ